MPEALRNFLQLLLSGVSVGAVYAIVSLGFVIIYKATDVFNFAQGELMTLGAFTFYLFVAQLQLPVALAFVLTLVVVAFFGFATEQLFLRPMVGEPVFSVVMLTVGLSIFLKGLIGLCWGHMIKNLPTILRPEPLSLAGLAVSPLQLATLVVTAVLVLVLGLFFKYSNVGVAMRAVANDQHTSHLMGISVRGIFSLSWSTSAVVAGIGGILLSSITFLHPSQSAVGIKVFPAVVLGGLDSIPGAIVGGIIIGIAENLAGGYIDPLIGGGFKEISSFVILLLIMMFRPYGLFGREQIERV
jgi:branched-chain amino acid transport system permease protein